MLAILLAKNITANKGIVACFLMTINDETSN